LSTSLPDESGSMFGFRIVELEVPGRLARLTVKFINDVAQVVTENVRAFAIDSKLLASVSSSQTLLINGLDTRIISELSERFHFLSGNWIQSKQKTRRYGPILQIVDGIAPLLFIHGSNNLQSASKLSHGVAIFGGPLSRLLSDREALSPEFAPLLASSNLVVLGSPAENRFVEALLAPSNIPITFPSAGSFSVHQKVFSRSGYGLISLTEHVLNNSNLALLISGSDPFGFETASRLFPFETGTPLPEWVVTSPNIHEGYIAGAGWWSNDWSWNEQMTYFTKNL